MLSVMAFVFDDAYAFFLPPFINRYTFVQQPSLLTASCALTPAALGEPALRTPAK
jgi:hypothetical protein